MVRLKKISYPKKFLVYFWDGLLVAIMWSACFFPGLNLAISHKIDPPISTNAMALPGEPFFVDLADSQTVLKVDGKNLLKVGTNKHFGIFSSAYRNKSYVVGFKTQDSKRNSFFSTVDYFSNSVEIKRKKLKSANSLRIPASVWKKVSSPDDLKREAERRKMKEVLLNWEGDLKSKCFSDPLKSKVTSKFASPRSLPNGKKYFHTGVDLRARMNTQINAMGDGKVVLAEKLTVPGRVVVISHGKGIFSRYMHLNKISVKVGDQVETGQKIGLSGKSGRVEAPHLHWEVIWKESLSNPHLFVQAWERLCDQG